MIGYRARYSLAQFLELYETNFALLLISKHSIQVSAENAIELAECIFSASDEALLSMLEEIARTSGDLRARINPKYRYNERLTDLRLCLQLDGYLLEDKRLMRTDPSIGDAPSLSDDLIQELNASGLSAVNDIVEKINASSESFRSSPQNYNACLNDVRVALETLARSIATTQQSANSPHYDNKKWGSVLGFLKTTGFITQDEEKGLAGVYGFVSPGSHNAISISDEEMTRLGRSLALGMCWFLVKSYRAKARGDT